MKLQIAAGSDGEWVVSRTIPAEELSLPSDPAFTDIFVEIGIEQKDRTVTLDIDVTATVSTECYHCGEPYSFTITPSAQLRCLRVPNPDRDSGDENLKFIGLMETTVDLEQDLRDLLLLELPMRIVCCEK